MQAFFISKKNSFRRNGLRSGHMRRFSRMMAWVFVLGVLMGAVAGCAPQIQERVHKVYIFPPQEVMESHEYAAFREQNLNELKFCEWSGDCDLRLFNLAFVHVYPLSPSFDMSQGITYLDDLIARYPDSPLAYQGRVWVSLIRESLVAEEGKRELTGRVQSKDSAIRFKDNTIKSKETTIQKLRDQIERLREIDLEIDQKERELLH